VPSIQAAESGGQEISLLLLNLRKVGRIVGGGKETGPVGEFGAQSLAGHQLGHLAERYVVLVEHAAQFDEGAQLGRLQLGGQIVGDIEDLRLPLVLVEHCMRLGHQHGAEELPDPAIASPGLVDGLLGVGQTLDEVVLLHVPVGQFVEQVAPFNRKAGK